MSEQTGAVERTGRVLVVDDEADMASGLKHFLKRLKYDVITAASAEQALEILKEEPVDVVLTDLMLPGISGLDLLDRVRGGWPDSFVVLITAYATVENAVQAIRRGAFDYISKPFTSQQLEVVLTRAFKHKALAEENRSLRGQIRDRFRFDSLVGVSEPMKRIHALLSRVSATDASVLVIGESGTGKELIARAIHANSRRQDKPFVPLDCAALPENLVESELFGYEKGAFTGASTTKSGLLEAANGGTFFMDEIGELELNMQVKLLRVLQERQFRRVGGNRMISVDVRIVAATNRELEKEAKAGRFREDLFHRLNVIQVRLPPLRDRKGDILLLAKSFLASHSARAQKAGMEFDLSASAALEQYSWPGNVRELQNAVEYAVSLAEHSLIGLGDLPLTVQESLPEPWPLDVTQEPAGNPEICYELPYKQAKRRWLESFERDYFAELLRKHHYNISHAARAAEIDRKSIQRILKKNNLEVDELEQDEDEVEE